MIRVIMTITVTAFLIAANGCAGERQDQKARDKTNDERAKIDDNNQSLTAETAKRAILEMDSREIPPGVVVPLPKDEPIEIVNVNEISIGRYHCNLKEKTFYASAFYPKADRHSFNHVSGVFERNPDGKWVAKVTKSSSGH